MSKLDETINDSLHQISTRALRDAPIYVGHVSNAKSSLKNEVKNLMLELIGEDEVFIDIPIVDHTGKQVSMINGRSYTPMMVARNDLRNELRKKVEAL